MSSLLLARKPRCLGEFPEDRERFSCSTVPRKLPHPRQTALHQIAANFRFARDLEYCLGQLLRAVRIEEHCRPTGNFGDGTGVRADDRAAASHSFELSEPE